MCADDTKQPSGKEPALSVVRSSRKLDFGREAFNLQDGAEAAANTATRITPPRKETPIPGRLPVPDDTTASD